MHVITFHQFVLRMDHLFRRTNFIPTANKQTIQVHPWHKAQSQTITAKNRIPKKLIQTTLIVLFPKEKGESREREQESEKKNLFEHVNTNNILDWSIYTVNTTWLCAFFFLVWLRSIKKHSEYSVILNLKIFVFSHVQHFGLAESKMWKRREKI